MQINSKDWLLLSILLVVWGLNYPAVKFGLEYSAPLAFSFYRVLIGTIASIPIALRAMRSNKVSKSFRNLKVIIITILFGATSTALFLAFWFIAESVVPAGITAVIIYTYPLFAVLFARMFLADKLTPLNTLGIVSGFIGAFLVLTSGNVSGISPNPFGFTLLFAAAILFGFSFIIYRKWLIGYERTTLNTLQLFFSGIILFVWTLVGNPNSLYTIQFTNLGFLIPLLFTAIVATAISFTLWMVLLEKRGAVWLSGWLFLVPVIALSSSTVLLHEQIDLIQFLGIVIIIFGIAAVNRK